MEKGWSAATRRLPIEQRGSYDTILASSSLRTGGASEPPSLSIHHTTCTHHTGLRLHLPGGRERAGRVCAPDGDQAGGLPLPRAGRGGAVPDGGDSHRPQGPERDGYGLIDSAYVYAGWRAGGLAITTPTHHTTPQAPAAPPCPVVAARPRPVVRRGARVATTTARARAGTTTARAGTKCERREAREGAHTEQEKYGRAGGGGEGAKPRARGAPRREGGHVVVWIDPIRPYRACHPERERFHE